MIRRRNKVIKESIKNIDVQHKFGVVDDYCVIYADNERDEIKLKNDCKFSSLYDFLYAVNRRSVYSVPLNDNSFESIHFYEDTSKIILTWLDKYGSEYQLYANIYNYPSYLDKDDLDKYDIELK